MANRLLDPTPVLQIQREMMERLSVIVKSRDTAATLEAVIRRVLELLEKSDITAACRELESAAVLAPHDADLQVCVGDLHAAQGDIESARRSYSLALVIESKHAVAREKLLELALGAIRPAIGTGEIEAGDEIPSENTAEGCMFLQFPAEPRPSEREGVFCLGCDGHFAEFLPYGNPPRPNALCPKCRTLERHRLLLRYLESKTSFFQQKLRLLDFAPINALSNKFRSLSNIDYLSVDLESPIAMRRMDITRLDLEDNSFDVIFCYHVLEHIPDDAQAMRELLRVLKPGGWAILQVPLNLRSEKTHEGRHITTPEERLRLFGQADHCRIYGLDYKDRLEAAGFTVKVDPFAKSLPESEIVRHGLRRMENIYHCSKSPLAGGLSVPPAIVSSH